MLTEGQFDLTRPISNCVTALVCSVLCFMSAMVAGWCILTACKYLSIFLTHVLFVREVNRHCTWELLHSVLRYAVTQQP